MQIRNASAEGGSGSRRRSARGIIHDMYSVDTHAYLALLARTFDAYNLQFRRNGPIAITRDRITRLQWNTFISILEAKTARSRTRLRWSEKRQRIGIRAANSSIFIFGERLFHVNFCRLFIWHRIPFALHHLVRFIGYCSRSDTSNSIIRLLRTLVMEQRARDAIGNVTKRATSKANAA